MPPVSSDKKKGNIVSTYDDANAKSDIPIANIQEQLTKGYFLIPTNQWGSLRSRARSFFSLTEEKKQNLAPNGRYGAGGVCLDKQGNEVFYTETVSPAERLERLVITKPYIMENSTEQFLKDAWSGVMSDARYVTEILAQLTGLAADNFISETDCSFLRWNLYQNSTEDSDADFALRPHTDKYSFVVVYSDDDESNLEVLGDNGDWNVVTCPKGYAAVILGSAAADMSKQELKASVHKVNRIGSKSRLSVNLCINPPEKIYDNFRNVLLSCPIVRQINLNFSSNCVVRHISLLKDVVVGPTPSECPKLPSWKDKPFWLAQIKRYWNYLSLYNRYLDGHVQCSGVFPDPPREMYYCWLVHMLQPFAYKQGCLNAFGRIIPHENHVPCFDREDDLNVLWQKEYGTDLWTMPSNCDEESVSQIFPLTKWWVGMDGVRAEYEEALQTSEELINGDIAFIEQVIAYYGRYLSLASLKSDVPLAPGCAIDIIWHAHQTSPVMYNEIMDMLPEYIDHVPCGEANPADPKWSYNTVDLWKQYFGDEMNSKVVPELDGVGGWCCCQAAGATTAKKEEPPPTVVAKKETELKQKSDDLARRREVRPIAKPKPKEEPKPKPILLSKPKEEPKQQPISLANLKPGPVLKEETPPKKDESATQNAPFRRSKIVKREEPKAEADTSSNKAVSAEDILNATNPMKAWGRSKLMIVGDGRAGKTCFSNALVGKPYTETKSTVGIDTMTIDVKFATSGECGGSWSSCKRREKEYEYELALQLASYQEKKKKGFSCPFQARKSDSEGSHSKANKTETKGEQSYYSEVTKKNNMTKQKVGGTAVKENESGATSEGPLWSKQSEDYNKTVSTDFNVDDVMKCLHSDIKNTTGDLQLSIYDYGGQKIFDAIHQFFLTANGVYAICFSMEWFLEGRDVEKCLSVIDFWVDSITANTCLQSGTAPVVFVGTHKDKVSDVRVHENISNMLYDRFSRKLLWGNIIPNDKGVGVNGLAQLWFYPVDNVGGVKEDKVFQELMHNIETFAMTSPFVTDEKPIAWLKGIDEIMKKKQPYLKYDEVKEILLRLGSKEAEVPHFLSFMHENGILMWHEEESLRDIVIMDPVECFVKPTTKLIRKLDPKGHDSTTHIEECHRACMRQAKRSWGTLVNDGIADRKLFDILYADYTDSRDILLALMQKFGIIVPIQAFRRQNAGSVSDPGYLVPPLLKEANKDLFNEEWLGCSQFTLAFSTDDDILHHSTIFLSYIATEGFMPNTLFEKILGKLFVYWQNVCSKDDTSGGLSHLQLCKNMAILFVGRRRFRLRYFETLNIIVVDIEGNENPIEIYERILNVVKYSLEENIKSLYCTPCLALNKRTKLCSFSQNDFDRTCEDVVLINFEEHKRLIAGNSILNKRGCGGIHLSIQDAIHYFCNWTNMTAPSQYDCFLSYRQGVDNEFVTTLFDAIKSVPTTSAVLDVFRDKVGMSDGHDFQMQFTRALVNSTVFCPLVSHAALVRMSDHDVSSEDNVLIEWILALVCLNDQTGSSRVARICPVFIGEQKDDIFIRKTADLFGSDLYRNLPDIVPTTSIETCCNLLKKVNINVIPEMRSWTVKSIVTSIAKFLFLCTWQVEDSSTVAIVCAEKVAHAVDEANLEKRKAELTAQSSGAGPSKSDSTTSIATTMKPLDDLSTSEVKALFKSIFKTDAYDEHIDKHELNGELLSFAEGPEELEELGIKMEKMKVKMLLSRLQKIKKDGVDVAKLA